MADQKKRISELPESTSTSGLYTIGVNSANESVKVPLGDILEDYDAGRQEAADAKVIAQTAQQIASNASTQALVAKQTAEKAASDADTAKTDAAKAADDAASVKETSRLVSGTGFNSAVLKDCGNEASASYATALGYDNEVSGSRGFATGKDNNVSGNDASAIGDGNTASGNSSVAEASLYESYWFVLAFRGQFV